MKNTQFSVSKFKTHCLKLFTEMSENKLDEIIITKKEKPIAVLKPITEPKIKPIFGILKDSFEIKGDIISPIEEEWDVLKEGEKNND